MPVDRCIERLHNHLQKSNPTLPLPISKLIKICTLCTSHCYFQYNNIFYKQKFGLPMGSPVYWTGPGSNTPQGANLPPITKTIQARRTRHAGHCWRSKDEIISDVLLWTPAYGQSKAGRPARTFIQQLCDDTWCNPEDLPKAMNDRETWRERVRDIRVSRTSWWWWWDLRLAEFLHGFILNP